MDSANQPFAVEVMAATREMTRYDNAGQGFPVENGVCYRELGPLPITIRYIDYDKMFPTALTVIVQYCEEPAQVTVRSLDGRHSETKTLGGTPGHNDLGIFRLYTTSERQRSA